MLTQDNKLFSIKTPLGEDVLLLARFSGREGLSEMFQFDMDFFSEHPSILFEDIIGKNVTVSILLVDGSKRFFNGLISRFSRECPSGKPSGKYPSFYYSATLVPWFWLLTRTLNSRIFQNLSVQDIVEKIFTEKGFTDFKFKLGASYGPKPYTVQYRETDFHFVSRLLEGEGMYYFFTHEKGRHTMVLADHSGVNPPCPTQTTAKYRQSIGEDHSDEDQIDSLSMAKQIRSGKCTLNDYNYETPNTDLKSTSDTTIVLGPGEREQYEYPGGYAKRNAGDALATIRMEEEESCISTLSGTGDCRAFASGHRFRLEGSPQDDWNNREYLLTRIRHRADQAETYFSGSSESGEKKIYRNEFDCIDHKISFRPVRRTPKPVLEGIQTAFVVGPKGEEIYTDEYGRVKVQFHWDREGRRDANSSCWLRVAQSMAGNGWGAMVLPRVGHEVVVGFIEGDPDRPIITGQVYHAVNRPPYALPDEKTKTTFKSSSSPGGGGFNEICFEDKQGQEQIFIHAHRDKHEWVGHEHHVTVVGDHLEKIKGDKHISVIGDLNTKVDGTISLGAGMGLQQKIGTKHAIEAGEEIHLKAGATIVVEAGAQITLKSGGSFIDIGPLGISLQGAMVKINSGGSAGSGAGSSPKMARNPVESEKLENFLDDLPQAK